MDDYNAEMYALVFWMDDDYPVPYAMNCIDVKNIENPLQLEDPNLKDDVPVSIKGQECFGKFIFLGRVFLIGSKSFIFFWHLIH